MPDLDYYAILGVPDDAGARAIQKAYARRMREIEDALADEDEDETEEERHLHEAYRVLSNPKRRARYDAQLWRSAPDEPEDTPAPEPRVESTADEPLLDAPVTPAETPTMHVTTLMPVDEEPRRRSSPPRSTSVDAPERVRPPGARSQTASARRGSAAGVGAPTATYTKHSSVPPDDTPLDFPWLAIGAVALTTLLILILLVLWAKP